MGRTVEVTESAAILESLAEGDVVLTREGRPFARVTALPDEEEIARKREEAFAFFEKWRSENMGIGKGLDMKKLINEGRRLD